MSLPRRRETRSTAFSNRTDRPKEMLVYERFLTLAHEYGALKWQQHTKILLRTALTQTTKRFHSLTAFQSLHDFCCLKKLQPPFSAAKMSLENFYHIAPASKLLQADQARHPERMNPTAKITPTLEYKEQVAVSPQGSSSKGPHIKRAKWHLGIRSQSNPMDIMYEVFRAMKHLGFEWKILQVSAYFENKHCKCVPLSRLITVSSGRSQQTQKQRCLR